MGVQTINGYVLFPHLANWTEDPTWERRWRTEVCSSEFGDESRVSFRAVPRVALRWRVTALDLVEESRLEDRLRAAKKSGKACAPWLGRSTTLAAEVTATSVQIQTPAWPFVAGDWIYLADDLRASDVRQISSVVGNTLTLSGAVSRPYPACLLVWPLLFGKFAAEDLAALTSRHGQTTISIQELTSAEAAPIGTPLPPIDGIGGWIIGDTFEVQ
ncbi:MAG TPA: hypothetical protein VGQ71_01170 [Terriglobales bacterium]|jgi:hypothetical protein|nr:hypothetical protein [Terriglobales bacterium]